MSRSEYHKETDYNDPFVEVEWWGWLVKKTYSPLCGNTHNKFYHREDGPAIITYFAGKVESEHYMLNGLHHNLHGPAIITYDSAYDIKPSSPRKLYFLLGNKVSEEDFNKPGFIDAFIMENS